MKTLNIVVGIIICVFIIAVIKSKYFMPTDEYIDPYQEHQLDVKYKELATAIYRQMKNNHDLLTDSEQNFINEIVIIHYGPDGVWRKYGVGLNSLVNKYGLDYLLPKNIYKIY